MRTSAIRLLIVTSEPSDQAPTRNTQELSAIQKAAPDESHLFATKILYRAKRPDLIHELRRTRPTVVHFICHGTDSGLMLEDDFGGSSLVDADWLIDVFAQCPSVRLVLLNVCNSAGLADALAASPRTAIQGAIGWRNLIPIDDACGFSAMFYARLADRESVGDACLAARLSIADDSGELVHRRLRADADFKLAPARAPVPWKAVTAAVALASTAAVVAVLLGVASGRPSGPIRDAIDLNTDKNVIHFFKDETYVRWDKRKRQVLRGVRILTDWWKYWPTSFTAVDAAARVGNTAYFFYDDEYIRFNISIDYVESGPTPVASTWQGIPAGWRRFDAAHGDEAADKLYLFRGGEYLRIDLAAGKVNQDPRPIAGTWKGVAVDPLAAVLSYDGALYFLTDRECQRYDPAARRFDPPDPRPIGDCFPGLPF